LLDACEPKDTLPSCGAGLPLPLRLLLLQVCSKLLELPLVGLKLRNAHRRLLLLCPLASLLHHWPLRLLQLRLLQQACSN
jgi:hypothetical protein